MTSHAWHFVRYLVHAAGAETQTSAGERAALARHAAGRRQCVEIGVWHGANTRGIREVMADDGVVTGIDPFPPGRLGVSIPLLVARREIARCARGRCQLIRATSADAARAWTLPIDFLFIDGDHSYESVRGDWEAWTPFVRVGGIVCLHDSHPTAARPIQDAGSVRFTETVVLHDPRFALVEVVETLTVVARSAPPA